MSSDFKNQIYALVNKKLLLSQQIISTPILEVHSAKKEGQMQSKKIKYEHLEDLFSFRLNDNHSNKELSV